MSQGQFQVFTNDVKDLLNALKENREMLPNFYQASCSEFENGEAFYASFETEDNIRYYISRIRNIGAISGKVFIASYYTSAGKAATDIRNSILENNSYGPVKIGSYSRKPASYFEHKIKQLKFVSVHQVVYPKEKLIYPAQFEAEERSAGIIGIHGTVSRIQDDAVRNRSGVLILNGIPGSGKTSVGLTRIGYLLESENNPDGFFRATKIFIISRATHLKNYIRASLVHEFRSPEIEIVTYEDWIGEVVRPFVMWKRDAVLPFKGIVKSSSSQSSLQAQLNPEFIQKKINKIFQLNFMGKIEERILKIKSDLVSRLSHLIEISAYSAIGSGEIKLLAEKLKLTLADLVLNRDFLEQSVKALNIDKLSGRDMQIGEFGKVLYFISAKSDLLNFLESFPMLSGTFNLSKVEDYFAALETFEEKFEDRFEFLKNFVADRVSRQVLEETEIKKFKESALLTAEIRDLREFIKRNTLKYFNASAVLKEFYSESNMLTKLEFENLDNYYDVTDREVVLWFYIFLAKDLGKDFFDLSRLPLSDHVMIDEAQLYSSTVINSILHFCRQPHFSATICGDLFQKTKTTKGLQSWDEIKMPSDSAQINKINLKAGYRWTVELHKFFLSLGQQLFGDEISDSLVQPSNIGQGKKPSICLVAGKKELWRAVAKTVSDLFLKKSKGDKICVIFPESYRPELEEIESAFGQVSINFKIPNDPESMSQESRTVNVVPSTFVIGLEFDYQITILPEILLQSNEDIEKNSQKIFWTVVTRVRKELFFVTEIQPTNYFSPSVLEHCQTSGE